MEVVIESKTSGSFTIDLGSSDTILKVKEKVAKHTLIPVHLQTLVFNGQTLSDDLDTAHYGIVRGSHVLLLYDHPGSRTDLPSLSSADSYVGDVGAHGMNTQPLEKMALVGRTFGSTSTFVDKSDYMTAGDVGSDVVDFPPSGEFINPFYTPTGFTDKLTSDVAGGSVDPPKTSSGHYYYPYISDDVLAENASIGNVGGTDKRKGNGGGSALMPPPPQRLKTSTGAPSKAIPDKSPKDKVIGGNAAMKPPRKMTVMMKPKSPAGAKGVPVEVYSGEKVSVLRKELEQLKAEKKMKLPDQYYFIHKQNPLYEEHLTFSANGVAPGDTIDIFPGSISDSPN